MIGSLLVYLSKLENFHINDIPRYQKAVIKDFNYKGTDETFKVHGRYKFELYGTQGGGGCDNADIKSSGGKGAYVYGEGSFWSEQTLTIRVGGQGTQGERGPNGGSSGRDDGSFGEYNYDASGGGGGSTSLYLGNTKLLIAGAGSGGVMEMNGCYGGRFGMHSCPVSGNRCNDYVESQYGIASGQGGNGRNSDNIPGSGGGGGNYGGEARGTTTWDEYEAMACSGSSYVNTTYITNSGSASGQRTGAGLLRITTLLECMPECAMCNSSTECSSCPNGKYFKFARCVSSCGDGYYAVNQECRMCNSLCNTCVNNADFCTSCGKDLYLYNGKCVSHCPLGTLPVNGTCKLNHTHSYKYAKYRKFYLRN